MPAVKKDDTSHERIGWLRAAVPGANDGILSTSSLVLGVAAAHAAPAAYSLRESPVSWRALCPWRQVNMFLCILRLIASRPNSKSSARNSRPIAEANTGSSRQSTSLVDSILRSRQKLPTS